MELEQLVENGIETRHHSLNVELEWLASRFERAIYAHFSGPLERHDNEPVHPPSLQQFEDEYAKFIKKNTISENQRLLLILALAPHLSPVFLDEIIASHVNQTGDFPQMGGVKGETYRGFLPTLETVLFILSSKGLDDRLKVQSSLLNKGPLINVLHIAEVAQGEPVTSGKLMMDSEYVELFTFGTISRPELSSTFPAQHISTHLKWDDLVLNDKIIDQIKDIEKWVNFNETLLTDWNMKSRITPGYRVLFYGPSGTGKTLTATLLGKYTGKDVFRVDLSTVVSKFIGETEKNLARLFDKAENKGWILFFDEADALFGKRTNVRDAHDKYANQEISFLLQRTETYPGLVILASNFKNNIDDAFARRFQSHIYFPPPKFEERLTLWQKAIPAAAQLDTDVNLSAISHQYELTGANIMNVVQHACLQSLSRGENLITNKDIVDGIKKEYGKEGKLV